MAIDVERALALELPTRVVEVERGRLRFFAEAIGETDPIYRDLADLAVEGSNDAGPRVAARIVALLDARWQRHAVPGQRA